MGIQSVFYFQYKLVAENQNYKKRTIGLNGCITNTPLVAYWNLEGKYKARGLN